MFPFLVGLTGSIGVGKSFVSSNLSKDESFFVIDYDLVSRAVVEPGTWGLRRYVELFAREAPGVSILTAEGTLDRKVVSTLIFKDTEDGKRMLRGVNRILRLPILLETVRLYLVALFNRKSVVVLDAPLLFEAGLDRFCSMVVVVYANEDVQIRRIMARDSFSEDDARARIASQMPQAEKVKRADLVFENSGSDRERGKEMVGRLAEIINSKARRKRRKAFGITLLLFVAVSSLFYIFFK